ncbi:MAG TPA: hypothetical protein VHD61_08805 [Lacunisphaera sp.]|nr:hypothetical protein [Lacunisphaera sp.]
MVENGSRSWIASLVDLGLLAVALGVGFLLHPPGDSGWKMLGAAVLVQLSWGPRGTRYLVHALASGAVIGALFAFYWRQAANAWPLVAWLALLPAWRRAVAAGWGQQLARHPAMRALRPAILAAVAAALLWPYLLRGSVGNGDGYWYGCTVADYVVQMRSGVFPVWVAQSDYAFYGGIFPLRLAPYLAHLAAVVDLVTLRQLPPYAVMNVVLLASLAGGVLSMYACLTAIVRDRPWTAMGLAWCYGLCPGVIGLVYAQDLFMSFCTLPFLPVVFLGVVRSFTDNDLAARLMMSGGLAAAWLAHPPIGLWCGLVAGATQVVRLATQAGRWWSTWKLDTFAAGLLVLLGGYSVVSVKSLGAIQNPAIAGDTVAAIVQGTFPGNWLPLRAAHVALEQLQLGYGLAALAVVTAAWARGPAQRVTRLLLGCTGGLLLLLVPVPFVTRTLWHGMPQLVLNITNVWPMQRLVAIAAAAIATAAAVWLRGFAGPPRRLRVFQGVLAAALAWGAAEAAYLVWNGLHDAPGWTATANLFRPENRRMTYSSLGPHLVRPRYFNHSVTDVQLEHRFLSLDRHEIIRNATDAILPGFGPGTAGTPHHLAGEISGHLDANPGILDLEPGLVLQPGRHYLLALEFFDRDYSGVLQIKGPAFFREYGLPEAGYERAFGSHAPNARWLALWQTGDQPEEVRLTWVPSGAAPLSFTPFARYELREYDPADLDVVLESLVPYRAIVRAPAASYLETPRLYYPGYHARVDGREAPVERSPDSLVMVRMEPGRHTLELTYAAPLAARLAYGLSAAGWLGFLGLGGWCCRRARVQRRLS